MTDNIYAAPKSSLAFDALDQDEATFYVVGRMKFIVLFLATCGFYSAYWFYRQWKCVKKATAGNEWPIARGLFFIFFVHSLFEFVNTKGKKLDDDFNWDHKSTATLIVGSVLIARIFDRLSRASVDIDIYTWLAIVMLIPELLCLLNAQAKFNLVSGDPSGSQNNRFGGWNIFWIMIGAVIWLLFALGALYPNLMNS